MVFVVSRMLLFTTIYSYYYISTLWFIFITNLKITNGLAQFRSICSLRMAEEFFPLVFYSSRNVEYQFSVT